MNLLKTYFYEKRKKKFKESWKFATDIVSMNLDAVYQQTYMEVSIMERY